MSPRSRVTSAAAFLATTLAHAHEGHGLPGVSHWHAIDTAWVVAAVAVVAGLWFKRRK